MSTLVAVVELSRPMRPRNQSRRRHRSNMSQFAGSLLRLLSREGGACDSLIAEVRELRQVARPCWVRRVDYACGLSVCSAHASLCRLALHLAQQAADCLNIAVLWAA